MSDNRRNKKRLIKYTNKVLNLKAAKKDARASQANRKAMLQHNQIHNRKAAWTLNGDRCLVIFKVCTYTTH